MRPETTFGQVTAYLDGVAIPSTPFCVRVTAAALHPRACQVRGLDAAAPDLARAGTLELEVHGRDAFGNCADLLPRWETPFFLFTFNGTCNVQQCRGPGCVMPESP